MRARLWRGLTQVKLRQRDGLIVLRLSPFIRAAAEGSRDP
jgi:hypothetical protein